MAPLKGLWRRSWTGSPYLGVIELVGSPFEHLIIRSPEVAKEFGADAEIADDGRTVSVAVGDRVAFGVVPRKQKAPMAVNVYRTPVAQKRGSSESRTAGPEAVRGDWAGDSW